MPCVTRQLLNILDLLKIVKTFPFIKKTGFKILKYLPASYNKITMFLMQGRKIYLPCNRTVGAKLGFIEFESQFQEKLKVFMFFKSCNKLIS